MRIRQLTLFFAVVLLLSVNCSGQDASSLKWSIKVLAIDSNEGIDVADFNRDGTLDVVAGRNWYAGPDYIPRPVRTIEDWSGYVLSNGDFAYDVDGDGWTDVIAGAFNLPEVYWYQNPGEPALSEGKMWTKHLLADTGGSENEGQLMYDLDGDGIPEWVVNSWRKNVPYLAWKLTSEPRSVEVEGQKQTQEVPVLSKVVIGQKRNGHGMGFGDLNGDGRVDLLFEGGWYEGPAENSFQKPWKLHADWEIHASVPILVKDLNEDGRNDVIIANGHDYGLFWWEQKAPEADGKLAWNKHLIDDRFSQVHAPHLADLDGDGREELIVGKRVYAHNGNDPGGKEPPCLYYYTWDPATREFTRHTIDEGRVGGGLQIRTADLNGDGRLDIAVAGKSGTYVLFNEGK